MPARIKSCKVSSIDGSIKLIFLHINGDGMDNLLQQGIAAAKAGENGRAFQILTRATQDRALAEQAWLWLSGVVEHDSERLFCLDNVLRINPDNEPARRGSMVLRQKGVFPSTPMPPRAAPEVKPEPLPVQPPPRPFPPPEPQVSPKNIQTPAAPAPTLDREGNLQDVSAMYNRRRGWQRGRIQK